MTECANLAIADPAIIDEVAGSTPKLMEAFDEPIIERDGEISAREIIVRRVDREWSNRRQTDRRRPHHMLRLWGLIDDEEPSDLQEAIDLALDAFDSQFFLMFVNDEQIDDLQERFDAREIEQIRFLRLVWTTA